MALYGKIIIFQACMESLYLFHLQISLQPKIYPNWCIGTQKNHNHAKYHKIWQNMAFCKLYATFQLYSVFFNNSLYSKVWKPNISQLGRLLNRDFQIIWQILHFDGKLSIFQICTLFYFFLLPENKPVYQLWCLFPNLQLTPLISF